MKRLSLFLILFLLIFTSCSKETVVKVSSTVQTDIVAENSLSQNNMPKDMPKDFEFMVRYGYGEVNKNEINTFLDTVTKDLIVNGTAAAKITLTVEEMRSIYEKMREINIMGTKKLVPSNVNCERVPYNEDSWEISINGETQTFIWSEKYCEPTSDANQLLELRKFIQQIVEAKDAYKKLPEAEGGYD